MLCLYITIGQSVMAAVFTCRVSYIIRKQWPANLKEEECSTHAQVYLLRQQPLNLCWYVLCMVSSTRSICACPLTHLFKRNSSLELVSVTSTTLLVHTLCINTCIALLSRAGVGSLHVHANNYVI